MIHTITHKGKTYAIIVSHRFNKTGVHFFTPNDYSQQLGYINHPKGHKIEPHYHNSVVRQFEFTQEVLFLKKGRLKISFFDDAQCEFESQVLEAGDALLLICGGHGFEVLEEIEMFEVKQGPYVDGKDITRFKPALLPRTV